MIPGVLQHSKIHLATFSGIKANRKLSKLKCSKFEDCLNPGLDRDELRRTGSESSLVLMFCVHVGSFIQLLLPKVGQAMEWQDSAFGRMANLLLKRLKEGKSLWPVLRFKQRATSKILSVSARSGKNQILKKRVHFAIALADLATAGETIRV